MFVVGLTGGIGSGKSAAAERFAALAPDDPPAAAYARRCQQFLAAGQGWDGVWILGEK